MFIFSQSIEETDFLFSDAQNQRRRTIPICTYVNYDSSLKTSCSWEYPRHGRSPQEIFLTFSISQGLVATGFWLGITFGRIILGFITAKVGEKLAIAIYLLICMGLELCFWLIPSFVASAVFAGFLVSLSLQECRPIWQALPHDQY
jgi:MFS family permease